MSITAVLALALFASAAAKAPAPPETSAVAKGLKRLADQQQAEGNWVGANDTYPTFVTNYAGVALLMEGSTLKSGTYAPNLRKALAWVEANAAASGQLGGKHPSEISFELNGHASAILFLVC